MNATETEPSTRLLSPPEVAKRLGVTDGTLSYWRSRSEGPHAVRVGKKLWKYPQDALRDWLADQRTAGAER